MQGKKGQAAVELLIILAVSMVALIAIYSYSSNSMAEMNRQNVVDQAQTSIDRLAVAADDVYTQGVGAKKKVLFIVPVSVDESKSGIEEDSFVLNVLKTDVFAKPNSCLQGSLPVTKGSHWVWLTAKEQCVFVGTEHITVDKTSSYVTLSQSDSDDDVIIITNNAGETGYVFLTESWTHSDVSFEHDITSFSFGPVINQQAVTLTYTSNASASGNYPGMLYIGAYFESYGDVNITLPLNAEVVVPETDLLIFPSSYGTTLIGGESGTGDLNVCNNSGSSMTDISFLASGDIASWIEAIASISSLAAGNCVTTEFTINVPGGQSFGDYTGTITATDDAGSTDSTAITVTVPAMSNEFTVSWGAAEFSGNGERLWKWTLENEGSEAIIIDKMEVRWWNDEDGAVLEQIWLDTEGEVWAGSVISQQEVDITDFTVPAGTTYTDNRLEYDESMKNDSENFQIVFTFTDSSDYTTSLYQP